MPYIRSLQGALIAFAIFMGLALYFPTIEARGGDDTILTISTFLFSILIGFFGGKLSNRFNSMIDYFEEENSYWIALYKVAGLMNDEYQKRLADLIDRYHIKRADFGVGRAITRNEVELYSVYDELKKVKDKVDIELIEASIGYLHEIIQRREKMLVRIRGKLTRGQWGTLIALAFIILVYLYVVMSGYLLTKIFTAILAAVIVLVLLVLRDIQNFRGIAEQSVNYTVQEMFEIIGRMPYVSKKQLKKGFTLSSDVAEYRFGVHTPGEEPEFEIRENKKRKKAFDK